MGKLSGSFWIMNQAYQNTWVTNIFGEFALLSNGSNGSSFQITPKKSMNFSFDSLNYSFNH